MLANKRRLFNLSSCKIILFIRIIICIVLVICSFIFVGVLISFASSGILILCVIGRWGWKTALNWFLSTYLVFVLFFFLVGLFICLILFHLFFFFFSFFFFYFVSFFLEKASEVFCKTMGSIVATGKHQAMK